MTSFAEFAARVFPKPELRAWADDYKVYDLTVAELLELAPLLKAPPCQTELCTDRVEAIRDAYARQPRFFEHKSTLVVAAVLAPPELYLMDGQHRLEFLRQGAVLPMTTVRVVLHHVRSEDEMRDLFLDLNQDSFKNQAYVALGIDAQRRREEVSRLLDAKYGVWFARTKKKAARLRTLAGFVEAFPPAYWQGFESAAAAVAHLEASNHRFIAQLGGFGDLYSDEQDPVLKGQLVLPLSYCNFVEFAQVADAAPYYEGKQRRKAIPPKTRALVWETEFGAAETGACPICKTVELSKTAFHGFHCGHIKSHKNGGGEDAANLRPICPTCNERMGIQDWDAYEEKKAAAPPKAPKKKSAWSFKWA